MGAAIGLREDYDAGALRAIAKRSKDGPQARRLLALAAIYDGATRSEVTDDKTVDKAERKRLQVENAAHKSARAKILTLADKTSNIRVLARSAPSDWSVKRRLEYLKWARDVVARLRGANDLLETKFDEAAREAERVLGV
jgi:hypothetical protein